MGIKFNELKPEIQERLRRENPSAFKGDVRSPMEPKERKPDKVAPLARRTPRSKTGASRVECVVTITNHRSRLLDDDNFISGTKVLRDCIAGSIGIDDGDARIRWQYHQIETKGGELTLVTIEWL